MKSEIQVMNKCVRWARSSNTDGRSHAKQPRKVRDAKKDNEALPALQEHAAFLVSTQELASTSGDKACVVRLNTEMISKR